MTLSPGFKLGPYEIVQSIGAGGMGEVYRAAMRGWDVFLQPIDGGEPRPLTTEGYGAPKNLVALDGKCCATRDEWKKVAVANQWWREWKRDSGTRAGRRDIAVVG